jgi:hypothetical protein
MIEIRKNGRRALTAAAVLAVAGLGAGLVPATAQAATAATPAAAVGPALVHPDGGNGYVSEGNLRSQPNLSATVIDTIDKQWVDFTCWIDGGSNGFGSDRWFKADYYGLIGYMSSGVVTSQPSLPSC